MNLVARLVAASLVVLAWSAITSLGGSGARAEEAPGKAAAPGTWIYDVRVVRVDPADPAVLEKAPPWQPAGGSGATVALPWADLLAGLQARGRTTILLDQRVTGLDGHPAEFAQQQIRPVEVFERRDANNQTWRAGTIETGTKGTLLAAPGLLQYTVDVRWEQVAAEGAGPQGMAAWKGSHPNLPAGETIVLPYRQQTSGGGVLAGLEVYVFITGWRIAGS